MDDRYRALATGYDGVTRPFGSYREAVVERLHLRTGETVIDVGCGTGLCFPLLQSMVGPEGAIVGIDSSPAMLARADARVACAGWDNVTLVEGPADTVGIPVTADAALFCAVHDVLRCRAALDNVLSSVSPGGRVAAAGGMWSRSGSVPVDTFTYWAHAPFVSTFEGFDRPWSHLGEHLDDLCVTFVAFGGGFVASGTVRARPATAGP